MTTPEDLTRKKRVRAGHRASATRMVGQVDTELASRSPDPTRLSQLKCSLEEKLDTLKALDTEILGLLDDDDTVLAEEIDQADEFKATIYAAIIKAVPTPAAADPGRAGTTPAARVDRVKLPKLTLRPFAGDVTQWPTFWDSFKSAVHDNDHLSAVDKFNYLKSLLSHTALEAVSGLTLTTANYAEAVSILEKRFGNHQQIITKHMDMLLNMEPVLSTNNLKGLRHLFDFVETHIRSLKSLGVTSDSYGSLLTSVLLSKPPSEIRLLISRKVSEDDWTLDAMLKVLEEELKARERAAVDKQGLGLNAKGKQQVPPSAATLFAGQGSKGPVCSYCQQDHLSKECKVVTQVEARKEILRKSGRCFICLRRGHLSRDCHSKMKCSKCSRRHHVSICQGGPPTASNSKDETSTSGKSSLKPETGSSKPGLNANAQSFSAPTTTSLYAMASNTILLQTAQATLCNSRRPTNRLTVRAILDTGSQRSYITDHAARALSLDAGSRQKMSIFTFGSEKRNTCYCDLVKVLMETLDEPIELQLLTVPVICEPLATQGISFSTDAYEHLAELNVSDLPSKNSTMDIDLLIGSDYYWELTTGKVKRGENGGPVAVETKLGWVLSGPLPGTRQECQAMSLVATHSLRVDAHEATTESNLNDTLRAFWELESLGITSYDRSVHQEFEESVAFTGTRYEVELPWKHPHPLLPDNYQLSLRRLQSVLRRLRQTPSILREYDSVIRQQIADGVVQHVEHPELGEVGRVHYLPHHAVVRQSKETTKVRVVYDASARAGGPSLNDCLFTGPKFDQRILDLLLRFRTYPIALTADVEKAFLNVSVADRDRDVLRFLWVDDANKPDPAVQILRFTRVVFGISSSPFLLNATIDYHLKTFSSTKPELVETLRKSMYVDDVVAGAMDAESASRFYAESKEILRRGGFNLRKFTTNLQELQESINKQEKLSTQPPQEQCELDETYAGSSLGCTQTMGPTEQAVLGVKWNVAADCFIFSVSEIAALADSKEPTKRKVTSIVGKFYDPLGLLSPVVIKFKIFFQELCERGLEWDQILSGDLLRKWQLLLASLQESPTFTIPRHFLEGSLTSGSSYSLHGFCDASKRAYGAVVYIVTDSNSGPQAKFLVSKTRVAPLRQLTIPRLELLSALLLARLINSVESSLSPNLSLEPSMCYTDSKVALCWIVGCNKEWKQFVQNRVSEIRTLLPSTCWQHCPGCDNPADLPSRGVSPSELSVSRLWHRGPDWLWGTGRSKEPFHADEIPPECLPEVRTLTLVANEADGVSIDSIIGCERYSSLRRLLSVTTYVLKFVRALKEAVKGRKSSDLNHAVNVQDLSTAELIWIRESQKVLIEDKLFSTWKKQFGLYRDQEGLWRCGGRLHYANISPSMKHPILLHRGHHLTSLVVMDAHQKVCHNGTKETLTEVRARFWIVKGRSLVRKLIHCCKTCRRYEGMPYQAPPPPPLPSFRVSEEPPFTSTGVDFAGPLYIRYPGNTRSNKVWLCLFTCCLVRAVHLDLVPDMTTASFLRCLKRFVARRGIPRRIVSDNGQTFKGAAKAIETMLREEEVQQYLLGNRISWLFNVEKAPWWGGIFERMIKSTKRCLRKVIGRAKLYYDELITALTEIEAILNSRPLTYLSPDDFEEPITPSHFLCGRRILSLPDGLRQEDEDEEFELVQSTQAILSKRLRHLNATLNHFWKRWRKEYLLELHETHRYHKGKENVASPSVGDIVLVNDDSAPRGLWKLAKVDSLIVGKDGQTRGAVLRVASSNGRSSSLQRPIQLLYPLEVASPNHQAETEKSDTGVEVPSSVENPPIAADPDSDNSTVADPDSGVDANLIPPSSSRPRRAAALEARDRVAAYAMLDQ